MKRFASIALAFATLTASLTAPLAALAQSTLPALPATAAEVRKVDLDAKKITLKHEEIKNLEMPPMTMVFQVKDTSLLANLKTGDKVMVTVDKVNGAYTVMSLEAPKP